MKKISITLLLLLVIVGTSFLLFNNAIFSKGSKQAVNEETSIDASELTDIDVTANVANISIEESPDDQIHVELEGQLSKKQEKKLDYRIEEKGDTLKVTIVRGNENISDLLDFSSKENGNLDLKIQLPEKKWADIRVSAEVGNIQATRVAGPYEIKTDVGDIQLDLAAITEDITLRSDVGNVELLLDEVPSNLEADLKTSVGKVNARDIEQTEAGGPALKIKTDVGNITVDMK